MSNLLKDTLVIKYLILGSQISDFRSSLFFFSALDHNTSDLEALFAESDQANPNFTCFPSTKVQILTLPLLPGNICESPSLERAYDVC
jgi:hypothetical protein